ncbi:type II toxin-antitoxin system Phd/YefM family antitoxin [Candidatus Poribacteria bacterium]|nr:type II toxin-antitoxin system Phd/YefM family antitoxin [Candidatus Poribacteria bacterium]
MRYVNVTEFKANLSRYLQAVKNEDIIVTRHGTPLAMVRRFVQDTSTDNTRVSQDAPDSQSLQSEGRFDGLDLDEYREKISPRQFKLLMEYVGMEDASPDFDPANPFYPEDL